VRESRREALPAFHEPLPEVLVFFRVMGASGKRMVDDAGLDPTTLDETELLRGRSQGAALRRRDAGLI
jgi:hypothetical protein